MFSIRMSEMRVSWLNSRDSMIAALPTLTDHIHTHRNIQGSLIETSTVRQGQWELQAFVNKSLSEVAEMEDGKLDDKHSLSTLTER